MPFLQSSCVVDPAESRRELGYRLHLFGLTALAYMWAQIAKTVQGKIAAGETDPFYANKLVVGRYYVERILPETAAHLAKLKSGAELMMALPAEAF